jgi:hypothetical protein
MMRVKVFITLEIDPEEYTMPADENPTEEIQESLEDYFHELPGMNVKSMKINME